MGFELGKGKPLSLRQSCTPTHRDWKRSENWVTKPVHCVETQCPAQISSQKGRPWWAASLGPLREAVPKTSQQEPANGNLWDPKEQPKLKPLSTKDLALTWFSGTRKAQESSIISYRNVGNPKNNWDWISCPYNMLGALRRLHLIYRNKGTGHILPILTYYGCSKKTSQTGWLKQQKYISHHPGVCKFEIRGKRGWENSLGSLF